MVIIDVDGIDEGVDDLMLKFWGGWVAGTKLFQPCGDFLLGEADIVSDAQFGQVCFAHGFLHFERFHLFIDALMGNLWRFNEGID